MSKSIRQFRVDGIITEPFRAGVSALINATSLEEAIRRYNEEYPKALLTAAREID